MLRQRLEQARDVGPRVCRGLDVMVESELAHHLQSLRPSNLSFVLHVAEIANQVA